jgi:predicted esterase
MPGLDGLVHVIRPSVGEPEGVLVLMHGRGTSEQDLAGLLEVLDPQRRFVGACPRGPLELPPMGFHWYAVRRIGYPDAEVLYRESPVGHFIDPHVVPELTTWVQESRASAPLP